MFERGKKQDSDTNLPFSPGGESKPAAGASAPRSRPAASRSSGEAAVIGPSITIDGNVRGDEDLMIEGEVSGTIQLANNSLTVGSEGKIRANVHAHSIFVDGEVDGDLYGTERVSIRSTARVRGNITSPRVSLDDGAKFKGSIEMDPEALDEALGVTKAASKSNTPAASAKSTKTDTKSSGELRFGKEGGTSDETPKSGTAG